jgi:hypothetical protein
MIEEILHCQEINKEELWGFDEILEDNYKSNGSSKHGSSSSEKVECDPESVLRSIWVKEKYVKV